MLKSYSPYSGIQESCFVEGKSGLFYPGVRVENISYPLTISSVRAAVCSCLANDDEPAAVYQQEPQSELLDYWLNEFGMEHKTVMPDKPELYNPVVSDIQNISKKLHDLCSMAVTTHSNFPVSSILEVEGGYVTGVNVEVQSWSLGLCAERVAICRALSHGITKFKSMYIYAPKSEFCSPCGSCRQVLNEFMPDKVLELHHKDQTQSSHFVQHLLPYGIITDELKK
jgi:cytidine deaminase